MDDQSLIKQEKQRMLQHKKATKGGFGDFNSLTTMCQALPTHIAFENV